MAGMGVQMLKRVFFDLETVPPAEECRTRINPRVIRKLCKRFAKSELVTRPEDANTEAPFTEEQFRMLALHAEYGRVLCVGIIVEEGEHILHRGVLGRERATGLFHLDEARTLRAFWKLLQDFNMRRDLIIGHNIMDFDLPFLYKRSRINRVRPTLMFSFARYRSAPVYDTLREWAHWNPHAVSMSLGELADILKIGISKTAGFDGSHVYDEYVTGNHEGIARYCLQDTEVVRAIYYRMIQPETDPPTF